MNNFDNQDGHPRMMQSEKVTSMDANFSQTKILSAQNSLRVFEILDKDRRLIQETETHSFLHAKFLNKDDLIAATTKNGELLILQDYNNVISTIKVAENESIDCISVFSPDDPFIVCGLSNGDVCLYKFSDRLREVKKLSIRHKNGVTSIDSNSKHIVSAGEDKIVHVVQVDPSAGFDEVFVFEKKFESEIIDVSVCRDDIFDILLFAVCLGNNRVSLYSSKIGEPIQNIQELEIRGACGVEFTKVGYCLVVATDTVLKTFAPDDEGKYVEIDTEQLQ